MVNKKLDNYRLNRNRLSGDVKSTFNSSLKQPLPLKVRQKRRFIKGPIPLDWISRACSLPGKGAELALALWYLSGLTGRCTVNLTRTICRNFCIGRDSKYRGLKAMEEAGLVTVERHRGRSPRVTLLEI
jgi:hypothetical protein